MRSWCNILAVLLLGGIVMTASAGDVTHSQTIPPATAPTTQSEKILPRTQYWFGVAVENIPAPLASQLKLKRDQGLLVLAVLPSSPAEKVGLKAEDLLIEVNGKPLSSQEDLAHAANIMEPAPKDELHVKPAKLTFLRQGDRATIDILSEPRPAAMLVIGGNMRNFTASLNEEPSGQAQNRARNYVLPNGNAMQVGPGYRVNLQSSDPSALSIKSIRALVANGQTIVLTQDTDAGGNLRNTISVGGTTYSVDKDKIADLPEDLRPLAEQLLKAPAAKSTGLVVNHTSDQLGTDTAPSDLASRVKELEQQNSELQKKLDRVLDLLESRSKATKP